MNDYQLAITISLGLAGLCLAMLADMVAGSGAAGLVFYLAIALPVANWVRGRL